MKTCARDAAMATWPTGPTGPVVEGSRAPMAAAENWWQGCPGLFDWLDLYREALAAGCDHAHLLAVFDAASASVSAHFRSLEALPVQVARPALDQHDCHRRIEGDLAAHRAQLASGAPLDPADCTHVFDALLIQIVRESPLSAAGPQGESQDHDTSIRVPCPRAETRR